MERNQSSRDPERRSYDEGYVAPFDGASLAPQLPEHRISVIIPSYNEEFRIGQALDSLAAQTRLPDEIVVVDDGSRDGTCAVVTRWSEGHDIPLRLLRQPNSGPAVARNYGIRESTGDLIALLDADDLVFPEHLQLLEEAYFTCPSLVLCFADVHQVEIGNEEREESFLSEKKRLLELEFESRDHSLRVLCEAPFASLVSGSYVPVSTSLFSRKAAVSIGLFDEEMILCEDRDFWLRLSRTGDVGYFPIALAKKRVHADNITHPRRMLPFKKYQLRVIEKMLRTATDMNLTPDEIASAERAKAASIKGLIYTSSRHGLFEYLGTLVFLLAPSRMTLEMLRPTHLLRSIVTQLKGTRPNRKHG